MKSKVILAAIAMVAAVSVSLAQNTNEIKSSESHKSCFVDANKNGVCDKHEDGTCKTGTEIQNRHRNGNGSHEGNGHGNVYGKNKNHGNCDGSGRTNGGKGANYVDTNKNGICDHRETVK